MFKIGWFSSGRGPGSRDLLSTMHDSIESGDVKAEISFVFCNRERGFSEETDQFLDLVELYQIPLVCFSSVKFREQLTVEQMADWRLRYDREIMQKLDNFSVELSMLAGYMLVVGFEMCQRYTMINLHPAEPGGPKGTWREVIWELIESRARTTGVMLHLATPDLDEGPPVTFCRFSIKGEPFDSHWQRLERESLESIKAQECDEFELFKLIRQYGVKRELPLIVTTVKVFSEGRVKIMNGRMLDGQNFKPLPVQGYDLSSEIDCMIV